MGNFNPRLQIQGVCLAVDCYHLVTGHRLLLRYPRLVGQPTTVMGEYALSDPHIHSGAIPHQAPLKPKPPLEEVYTGLNASPEHLKALQQGCF